MPDPVVHVEVHGPDATALKRFYADTFGWNVTEAPGGYGYVPPLAEGSVSAGIGDAQGQAPFVTFYVGVDDPDAYLARIADRGGRTLMPTTTMPEAQVTIALFADPAGNTIGLLKNG